MFNLSDDNQDPNEPLEIDQWWFTISFPYSDYKLVLQRVKEFKEAAARNSEASKSRDAGSGSERVPRCKFPRRIPKGPLFLVAWLAILVVALR